jgi:ribonuclease-3
MQYVVRFLFRFYNYFLARDRHIAKRLKGLIGFTPSNLGIFVLAFSHKSNQSEKAYAIQNNERLEYLGDAVLGTIVAEYLFKKYPHGNEGFLTKMRSKIVKRKALNQIGDRMGLDTLLAEFNNTRLSRSMLGNAVEALVGAVYLECGYADTKKFVIKKILKRYVDVHELENFDDNYKSQLLEWCQKSGKTVSYKLVSRYKADKRDRFKVAVMINGQKIATADDFNKKSAEQLASEKALSILDIHLENNSAR